jgi:hypothetical protein
MSEDTLVKTDQEDFSQPQRHFIEQHMSVIEKPRRGLEKARKILSAIRHEAAVNEN